MILTKDRLQDIFHANTEAVIVDGTPIIVLRNETFEKVYDLLLHEMLENQKSHERND